MYFFRVRNFVGLDRVESTSVDGWRQRIFIDTNFSGQKCISLGCGTISEGKYPT